MNALATAIQQLGLTGSPAEIVAAFQVAVETKHAVRWTYAGLAQMFGYQAVGEIDEKLKATPGMDWVRILLGANGIDFSDSETQKGLDALPIPDEMRATLKAIGITSQSLWQQAGLDAEPKEDDCKAALAEIANYEWVHAAIAMMSTGFNNGMSKDEIKNLIAQS